MVFNDDVRSTENGGTVVWGIGIHHQHSFVFANRNGQPWHETAFHIFSYQLQTRVLRVSLTAAAVSPTLLM